VTNFNSDFSEESAAPWWYWWS